MDARQFGVSGPVPTGGPLASAQRSPIVELADRAVLVVVTTSTAAPIPGSARARRVVDHAQQTSDGETWSALAIRGISGGGGGGMQTWDMIWTVELERPAADATAVRIVYAGELSPYSEDLPLTHMR